MSLLTSTREDPIVTDQGPVVVRPVRALLPRWSLGAGYAVLWLLGAGFLWLPLAALRLATARRWRHPTALTVVLVVLAPLMVSLAVAAVRGAPAGRLVAAVFLLVPWALLGLATVSRWTPHDVRQLLRGLLDLALIQGVLVAVGRAVYPRFTEITLPLGHLVPERQALTPPLDAWMVTHLAFPDFYNGTVIRSSGILGNPTWAGAMAALALLCLLCRPRDLVDRRWWTWVYAGAAVAASVVTLVYAYSRNDVLGLLLGLAVAGAFAVLLRLPVLLRRLVLATTALATVVAGVVLDVGSLFRDFNAPRAGSLEARQAIYVQTLQEIHRHSLLLGSGVKAAGQDVVASLGSHSTYLGLVYRGGWLAFWGFVLFLAALLVLACTRRSPLALGLTAFVVLWSSAEDLDAGHLVPVALVLAVALVQRPQPLPGHDPCARLADELVEDYTRGDRTVITWVNHWSALTCLRSGVTADRFTLIGLDGNGLRRLVPQPQARTSADLVLPLVLPRLTGARIALLGGSVDGLPARVEALTSLLAPCASVVAAADGYAGRLEGAELRAWIDEHRPDVVLLALGAPLQEQVALELADVPGLTLIATCGGFLDQVAHGSYYPRWAYPLRLNWLVRVAREPRRLWLRYTAYVVVALLRHRQLRRWVQEQPGYARCAAVCEATPADLR